MLLNPFEELMTEIREVKEMLNFQKAPPSAPIEIIGRKELLNRLDITEPTAIRWGKRGVIPEIHIGSNVRYNWPAVVSALEKKSKR